MSQLGLGKTGPTVTWREPTTSYYSPPSSISAGDVVDFVAGFVPGYDLAKAIMNPNATGMDYAVGVLGVVPGFGKGASLGLKGASTVMRVENAAVHGLSAVDNLAAKGAGNSFSVITSAPVSGATRSAHRASANADLAAALRTDPAYAAQMNKEFGTDVLGHMQSGKGGLRNPPGTEWHHPKSDPSSMWLLKGDVHRSPSLQDYLHGGGSGGFADYYGR